MHRTVVIGGTSPLGYAIAYAIKSTKKTCVYIVDLHNSSLKENQFTALERYISLNKSTMPDVIIVNFYELLNRDVVQHKQLAAMVTLFNFLLDALKLQSNSQMIFLFKNAELSLSDDLLAQFFEEYFTLFKKLIDCPLHIYSIVDGVGEVIEDFMRYMEKEKIYL